MKALFGLTLGIIVGASFICEARKIADPFALKSRPVLTPYVITTQDANSRVLEQTVYEAGPFGLMTTNTHSYTELCSGLNHWINGQWVESKEQIYILPNGTAVATNGQHQVIFPGDIYQGQIELVTPDGKHLKSRPLVLNYFDGNDTVIIAELTNSTGVVVGNNQVIYPNAFAGINADLRYTYTKAGFEQDIILRQQPPTPESLGLNGDTARLQVMTEFFSPPQPTLQNFKMPIQAGLSLTDQRLDFGAMQMIPGRAFLMGQNAKNAGAMVSKHWVLVRGRQFLVEEVPVGAILQGLAALPLTAMNNNFNKNAHTASKHLNLPPQRSAENTSKSMLIAKADLPAHGFVLDYQTLSGTTTNYTFRGDTTYYVSGSFYSYGTNTFEGGAVIKYATNGAVNITPGPPGFTACINWQGSAYRPVIFTAQDDNSVGDTLTNSTGIPIGYYGNPMLTLASLTPVPTLTGLRMSYAKTAIQFSGASANIYNAQFINCSFGIGSSGGTVNLRNVLFATVGTNFTVAGSTTINAQNVTFSGSGRLWTSPNTPSTYYLTLTNCLLANVASLTNGLVTLSGSYNGFYSAPTFGSSIISDYTYPFQAVGAGYYYLTNGSGFQNIGTTNIDATLLASLKQRTTYPPLVYSNVIVATNITLSPQALRNTGIPDLGYHYDPIDYLVDQLSITNALLTITNGVAIGYYNDTTGIWLKDGSSILSMGSPLNPNWIVSYSSVQEQPIAIGLSSPSSIYGIIPYHLNPAEPSGLYRFTKFACPAGGGTHVYHNQISWCYTNLLIQDCEFWGGKIAVGGYSNTTATLNNNLFARCNLVASGGSGSYLFLTNDLFWGVGSVGFVPGGSAGWYALNNYFDSCSNITSRTVGMSNANNNAYFNSTGQLNPTNATDIFLTNAITYQTGPLGGFYQPTTSPLINVGSTNAGLVGLYHYTVTTNEVVEGTNIVSIGYHYVAVDTNGISLDTDGDGLPDYFEDANGNGIYDTGDPSNWQVFSTDGTGMSDGWEIKYFGHIGVDPNGDPDGDGLTNLQEYLLGTNPMIDDSTLSGSRLNYIYDAGGWLQTVSGAHSGSVSPDSEGNIQTVSQ